MFPEAQIRYDLCKVNGGNGLLSTYPTQMPALNVLKNGLKFVNTSIMRLPGFGGLLLALLQMCT